MKLMRATLIISFLLNLCLFSMTSYGQIESQFDYDSTKTLTLGPVRIVGADDYDHSTIRLLAGLRPGLTIQIPGDKITNAIKNLWKEELFSDVRIYSEKVIDDVVYLVIELKPRPKLSRFKFRGAPKREVDKIREEINLFSGKVITENLVFNTKQKIKAFYREKGFNNAQIDIVRKQDSLINNSELFYININKGSKVKIQTIDVQGVTVIPAWKINWILKETKKKKSIRVWKKSKFNQKSFEEDQNRLLSKLKSKGYRDATITFDTVIQKDPKNLAIKIIVDEGKPYYFGDFTWLGNTKFSSGMLDTVLGIKRGELYNKLLLDERLKGSQDGRDISSMYMDRGYLFFQMNPIETGIDSNFINFEVRMMEGKEARIRTIIIKGNTKTNEEVIRRELRTKPGDLFNRNDIIRTQRELANLGYFNPEAFQINPIPNPADGTVDIEYIVEEKSSDQIELSGGVQGRSIIGTLGLSFNNFSTRNIFKKSAWSPLPSGDGQRLSIRGQTSGRFFQSYTFSFTEPWFGGKKPNSLSYWLNHTKVSYGGFKKSEAGYNAIKSTGTGVGFGRRKKVPDDWFQAYYELAYQYYDVLRFTTFPAFSNGFANDISLKYVLSRNSMDQQIYPREGSKIQFSAKSSLPYFLFNKRDWSGASNQDRFKFVEYYKLKITGEWYLPVSKDKKLVLMTRVGYGFLGAYDNSRGLSPFERYVVGGSGMSNQGGLFGGQEIVALRGYEDGELSSNGGDPLVAKYTMELRYPISLNPQATFFVTAWGEAANTFTINKDFNPFNVKRAAGFGLRAFLPMFGMLGIDYGWGFDTLDKHSRSSNLNVTRQQKGYAGKLTFTLGMNIGDL